MGAIKNLFFCMNFATMQYTEVDHFRHSLVPIDQSVTTKG
jgi:hypothetical protein